MRTKKVRFKWNKDNRNVFLQNIDDAKVRELEEYLNSMKIENITQSDIDKTAENLKGSQSRGSSLVHCLGGSSPFNFM